MPWRGRSVSPYRVYLGLECGMSFLLGISYATVTVYWVISGRLNPLQLLLLGTSLELSYFLFQLPTGALADLVSRRLCVLTGLFIVGAAQVMASLSASFGNLIVSWAVLGLGAALNNGAQDAWIADELSAEVGDDRMTGIYLRATQLGLIATVAGSLLSGVIALAGLDMPLRVGGALICLLAVAAAFVMPERHFQPAARAAGVGSIVRQAAGALAEQTRSTHRAVVAVPGLVLLFGMTLFVGLWSESFDRLWGAFLLRDIRFPHLGGLHPAMWFSLFACAAAVLGLGATEVAKRRTRAARPRLGRRRAAGADARDRRRRGRAGHRPRLRGRRRDVPDRVRAAAGARSAALGLAGGPDRAVCPRDRAVRQGHVRQRRSDRWRTGYRRDRHVCVTADRAAGRGCRAGAGRCVHRGGQPPDPAGKRRRRAAGRGDRVGTVTYRSVTRSSRMITSSRLLALWRKLPPQSVTCRNSCVTPGTWRIPRPARSCTWRRRWASRS